MGCVTGFSKLLLILINFLDIVAGSAIAGYGVYLMVAGHHAHGLLAISIPLFAVGGFLLVQGVFSCLGAHLAKSGSCKCCLTSAALMGAVTMLAEAAIGAALLLPQTQKLVHKSLSEMVTRKYLPNAQEKLIERYQKVVSYVFFGLAGLQLLRIITSIVVRRSGHGELNQSLNGTAVSGSRFFPGGEDSYNDAEARLAQKVMLLPGCRAAGLPRGPAAPLPRCPAAPLPRCPRDRLPPLAPVLTANRPPLQYRGQKKAGWWDRTINGDDLASDKEDIRSLDW